MRKEEIAMLARQVRDNTWFANELQKVMNDGIGEMYNASNMREVGRGQGKATAVEMLRQAITNAIEAEEAEAAE